MNYRVMKFGGSSVGAPERLRRVTELVAKERDEGKVAVVVSAMGDSTDWLIEAADAAARGDRDAAERIVDRVADLATTNGLLAWRSIADGQGNGPEITPIVRRMLDPLYELLHGVSLLRERTAQTLDLILSFGERLSATVVAELLLARGVEAVFVDAREWTVTDDRFGSALVDWSLTQARLSALAAQWGDAVPVHTGFLGRTPEGRTTTLGRNGSDYTATLLARGLGASEVSIWTDVLGVMTADPALVRDAYPLQRMTYGEALELASYGARMFHPRTMIPLIESGIPMRIRSTMNPDAPGTRIDGEGRDHRGGPVSVTSLESLALVGVRSRRLSLGAQLGHRVLSALAKARVTVWMASQGAHGQTIAVVVPDRELSASEVAIRGELSVEQGRGDVEPISVRRPVTLLSLVAETMEQAANAPGRFFDSLGAVGVNVLAIAQGASSRSISCAIEAPDTARAVRAVHAAFNFAHQDVSLLVLGKGTVGKNLLGQIAEQRAAIERDHDLRLHVVGLADSRGWMFDDGGIDVTSGREPRAEKTVDGRIPIDLLERLRRMPVPILVDCTAAEGMEALYAEAFARGIHVVAANKKPLTIPWPAREALMSCARRHHSAYHYETTVGASLPVIETLKNLVRTGDRVHLVEGAFSGTLGYLANEVMAGRPLSTAVRAAMDLGYTEPEPQDDLSGTDVARKALILARELGFALSLEDVRVEPLVPRALIEERSIDRFFELVESYDATFAARVEDMKAEGRTLRYLARIDSRGGTPSVHVGIVGVEPNHPAAHLMGSEAFIAFRTERYRDYPLLVQGAGAGGAVTAAGVLADILKIAQTLRGR